MTIKEYIRNEQGDEAVEKAILIGAAVVLALLVVTYIGKRVGEMIGLLNT